MASVPQPSLSPKPPDPPGGGVQPSPTDAAVPLDVGAQVPPTVEAAMPYAPQAPKFGPSGVRSYAAVAAGPQPPLFSSAEVADSSSSRPKLRPRFPPIPLPSRQVGTKNGLSSISSSGAEVGACEKSFEHSIIAKFTAGHLSLSDIQKAFQSSWCLSGRASLSEIWDSRHVLVIFDSEEDVRVALSSPLNKVGHAYFRLFRWYPDYNPKSESKVTTIWVRLPGLPLSIYDCSFIEAIISTFGYFVSVDDRTKACTSLKFARACVELDVTKPIPKAVWINMPDNRSYRQVVEVESKLAYCTRCKVHGHSLGTCRKRKELKPKKNDDPSKPVGDDQDKHPTDHVSPTQDLCEQHNGNTSKEDIEENTSKGDVGKDESSSPVVSKVNEVSSSPPQADHLAMVRYNGPMDLAESSSVRPPDKGRIPLETVRNVFEIVKPFMEEQGVFEFPKHLDKSFMDKMDIAMAKYQSLPEVPENDSPPISEWIPAKNKRKKKGKQAIAPDPSPSPLEVRRSSRARQPTEVKNPDYIYPSKGL